MGRQWDLETQDAVLPTREDNIVPVIITEVVDSEFGFLPS